ncbi:MAG: methyltransferase [bacterium]
MRHIIQRITRKLRLKRYSIGLLSVKPVSDVFGFDRGTPIDRLYIENFLAKNRKCIQGKVLEVAEATYTAKFGDDVSVSQILNFDEPNSDTTLKGDLTDPQGLPSSVYDCFICTQTLNFIYDVKSAIIGCRKLLADGGVFLGTVAGLSQISRYDMDRWGDYWRFTDLSIRKMFEEVFGEGHVEVQIYGNALAASAFIQGLAVEDIPKASKLMQVDKNYQIIIGIRAVK